MSKDYDRGPIQTYEIVWKSGHIETIQAHQVTTAGATHEVMGAMLGVTTKTDRDPRIVFHGELDGQWLLVLSALERDISTVRLLPVSEQVPTGGDPQ